MAAGTGIEWTEATWNPVSGCTRVSAGCDHCYAVQMTHRLAGMGQAEKYGGLTVLNPKGDRHFNGEVRCHEDALAIPLEWRKPRLVFVNSMSDLFHKGVPFEFIDRVFAVMALCPQHTFQVLTKRPERMAEYLNDRWRVENIYAAWSSVSGAPAEMADWPLPNVWLGTSTENQATADERIPHLLRCHAAVRFLSCEPLLGPIEVKRRLGDPQPGWVIVGGESGRGARPCDIDWIRAIIRQCRGANVPVFVKQLGARPYDPAQKFGTNPGWWLCEDAKGGDPEEWPEDLRVREFPESPRPSTGSDRTPHA